MLKDKRYFLMMDTVHFLGLALWVRQDDGTLVLLDKKVIRETKNSSLLHQEVDHILVSHHITFSDLSAILTTLGPGSYTGMRLSFGFSDVLKFLEIPVYGVYHYEIPSFLKINNYQWFCAAFKGEVFVYTCPGDVKSLVYEKDFDKTSEELFTHWSGEGERVRSTGELFLDHLPNFLEENIFSKIKEERSIHYFRHEEQEFQRPKPILKKIME
jgi:tRNA A37 threonylcarbamoyladenosine modification protein TsaB